MNNSAMSPAEGLCPTRSSNRRKYVTTYTWFTTMNQNNRPIEHSFHHNLYSNPFGRLLLVYSDLEKRFTIVLHTPKRNVILILICNDDNKIGQFSSNYNCVRVTLGDKYSFIMYLLCPLNILFLV